MVHFVSEWGVSKEYVLETRQKSQDDKRLIGLGSSPDKGLSNVILSIEQWSLTTLPIATLGLLQMYVSKNPGHGTGEIFNLVKALNFNKVASSIDSLRKLENPAITGWLHKIDRNLYERIVNNETQPLIICWPPLLEAGNMLDGNHRLLALLKYQNVVPAYRETKVLIGAIPRPQWMMKFSKSFIRSGLKYKMRQSVANERLCLVFEGNHIETTSSYKSPIYTGKHLNKTQG